MNFRNWHEVSFDIINKFKINHFEIWLKKRVVICLLIIGVGGTKIYIRGAPSGWFWHELSLKNKDNVKDRGAQQAPRGFFCLTEIERFKF